MPIELPRRRPPSEHVVGRDAVHLVSAFEGLSLKAYPDPASQRAKTGVGPGDPWTIGYGRTRGVKDGDTCTLFQADEWLMEDLNAAANIVKAQIVVPLTSGEFTALVSLVFNLGYIPRSLKAALNGGTSDKGEVFQPGSYGSALKQFVRNCRAAGMPMRGLLRRRLAEACVYSDLPWEAACSINLIRLKCDAKGNIDPFETTSLEDTLERARQDVPMVRPPIDVTKPWPVPPAPRVEASPAPATDSLPGIPDAINSLPTQLPLPSPVEDEDELFLDTPAAAEEISGAKGSPPVLSQPVPAAVPPSNPVPSVELSGPGTGPAAAEKVAPRPSAPPVAVPAPPLPKPSNVPTPRPFDPPVIAGQGGTKPMHPETKMPDMIPYRIDPNAGAKPLESTERFLGSVFILLGTLTRTAMANGFKLSGASGVIVAWILTLMKDPVHFAIFVAFVAMAITGVLWLFGVCLQKFGIKKKRKGEAGSSQLMY